VTDKYKLTLHDSTHLSNTELAEVYDILLEQAARKAKTELGEEDAQPSEHPSQSQIDVQVKSIQVSNDLMLEVWPRGSGDDDHPLVTLWSLGQESAGDRLGVVVIWQSELLPLVSALTEAAMTLAQEPTAPLTRPTSGEHLVQTQRGKEGRPCPKCGTLAQREVSPLGQEDQHDDIKHTIRYRCPQCAHTWSVLMLENE